MDLQLSLINQHIRLLSNNKSTPYLQSSFNPQFDRLLHQLVIDYEFDFDKIALHLYYQFPVYEQKINSRTVAVRWWQVQMQNKIALLQNGKEQANQLKEEMMEENEQHSYENSQGQKLHQSSDDKHLTNVFDKSQSSFKKSYQPHPSVYKQALQQSLILQQQQSQRLIMYKPKFITDTHFQLQRYELYSQPINQPANQNQETQITQLLERVVNNQFVYDEFGSFQQTNLSSMGNQSEISLQKEKRIQKPWWQNNNDYDSSSEDQLSSNQSLSSQSQDEEHKYKNNQPHQSQQPLVNNFMHEQNLSIEQNPSNNPSQNQQNNHKNPPIPNEIYQNWDEYESD